MSGVNFGRLIDSGHDGDQNVALNIVYPVPHNAAKAVYLQNMKTAEALCIKKCLNLLFVPKEHVDHRITRRQSY